MLCNALVHENVLTKDAVDKELLHPVSETVKRVETVEDKVGVKLDEVIKEFDASKSVSKKVNDLTALLISYNPATPHTQPPSSTSTPTSLVSSILTKFTEHVVSYSLAVPSPLEKIIVDTLLNVDVVKQIVREYILKLLIPSAIRELEQQHLLGLSRFLYACPLPFTSSVINEAMCYYDIKSVGGLQIEGLCRVIGNVVLLGKDLEEIVNDGTGIRSVLRAAVVALTQDL
jgi:hypothetical protein